LSESEVALAEQIPERGEEIEWDRETEKKRERET
jgi:hypothetical protein